MFFERDYLRDDISDKLASVGCISEASYTKLELPITHK